MFNLKNLSREQKIEYVIVFSIFAVSIIVGILVGRNEEWFRPAFFSAGYMSGSLITCLLLFSIYRSVSYFLGLFNRKTVEK
ncbi:hypothetical protein MM300_14525 [Evansella sp. LMS18]|jgi:Na+/proline symporter|uniref:hypothetical protein n=1 Tax=Evansella sp. LMS18 TaxID=2924033 RepID=UPI0020D114DC|nr:hypothetical protein [Evansella sp. LMS18]UTR09113.1 hypothetical protein MM300_14525 [Evansella sp. LMS18]